jgi:hypothetical protein
MIFNIAISLKIMGEIFQKQRPKGIPSAGYIILFIIFLKVSDRNDDVMKLLFIFN